jgi:hypothetical protein
MLGKWKFEKFKAPFRSLEMNEMRKEAILFGGEAWGI